MSEVQLSVEDWKTSVAERQKNDAFILEIFERIDIWEYREKTEPRIDSDENVQFTPLLEVQVSVEVSGTLVVER